jgi:predicted glycosyltransferase involved in capsule biosynthesis
VLAGWEDGWSDDVIETRWDNHASLIAIAADLWDRVGGFDERFEGWGWEDVAFRLACETLLGPMVVLRGVLWHLWHPTDPNREAHNAENRQRLEPFIAAQGDRAAMAALVGR